MCRAPRAGFQNVRDMMIVLQQDSRSRGKKQIPPLGLKPSVGMTIPGEMKRSAINGGLSSLAPQALGPGGFVLSRESHNVRVILWRQVFQAEQVPNHQGPSPAGAVPNLAQREAEGGTLGRQVL